MAEATPTPITTDTPEEWRSVRGYEGLYEVSDQGRVRRIWFRNGKANRPAHRPTPMTPTPEKGGYFRVALSKDGMKRSTSVSNIVAAAFLGPKPAGLQVAHLDGIRTHNVPSNLAYVTAQQNSDHKHLHGTVPRGTANVIAKLNDEAVAYIRANYRKGSLEVGLSALGRRFGVSAPTVRDVVTRQSWTHVA